MSKYINELSSPVGIGLNDFIIFQPAAVSSVAYKATASSFANLIGGVVSVNLKTGAVVLVSDDISDSTSSKKFVTQALIDKVGGIEAGATADLTGSEIKTLYQAQTNAYTDAKDAKLSGIETGATADQTASEIGTLYEGLADTNKYTDAEKAKVTNLPANTNTSLGLKADLVGGIVPTYQLPPQESSSYLGGWNATTNTPNISDAGGLNGQFYIVDVGGTIDLGHGNVVFVTGGKAYHNGTQWEAKDPVDAVASVAGKTGVVTLDNTDVGLGSVENKSSATIRSEIVDGDIPVGIARTADLTNASVGLGNVENKSSATIRSEIVDANIPVTIARTADITKASIGLGSVENKSSATIRGEIVDADIPATIARDSEIPTTLAALSGDSTHRTVTDAEKAVWNTTSVISTGTESQSSTLDFETYDMATMTLTGNLAITSVTNLTAIGKRLFVLDGHTLSIYGTSYTNTRDGACSITFENWGEATPRVIDNYKVDAAPTEGFSDAPSDNKVYGRRNGQWVEIEAVDTVPDAPVIATSINGLNIEIDITAGFNGGQAITGWHIQHSADGSTGWADVVADTGNTTTPYVISSPANGDHYYQVAAINSIGESAWSNVDGETITAFTIGETDVLGSPAGLNDRRANQYTVPQDGTIVSISLYHGADTDNLSVGIYSNNANAPDQLLAVSATVQATNALGWQTIDLTTPLAVTAGQVIWIAFICSGNLTIYYGASTVRRAEGDTTFPLSNPWGAGTVGNSAMSLYANAVG